MNIARSSNGRTSAFEAEYFGSNPSLATRKMKNMDPMKSATELVKGIRVSSVLGSLVFIIPFFLACLVVVSFGHNVMVQMFLMWMVGSLLFFFMLCYGGILIFGNHKELQSEDHTYRMKALEVFGDQNHKIIDVNESLAENNPELPSPKGVKIPEPSTDLSIEKTHE